ncbi:MAG: acyltransferase domain-containing protein [Desulfuromonadaceae bacterium]|nr:acyltransferase domain-containing protein [Desulfuromonadaceae bacterium]
MICWMFPGQPIAFVETSSNDAEFNKIALLCQDTTGFNPLETGTSASPLSQSVRLQLLGTCVSLHRASQLTSQGNAPDLIAEHSMGIYPALAVSGSIDNETALALTCRIGVTMAEMSLHREYALGCVIGLTSAALETIAANNGIHIANHNTSRHFLLAGEREKVATALIEATASGAFSVSSFPCDAPLHTPLINEIAGSLQRIVAEYSYSEPGIPLVEHIEQTALTSAAIPRFLVDELSRPVYWGTTYRVLRSRGVTCFQEVGVGSALSKFNRWIDSES